MGSSDPDLWAALAALVVKQGVSLGGLGAAERTLMLGFVWAGLPAQRMMSEREVNEALRRQLASAAACLDTDHVELRRWLVDAGWLQRDGFGRAYRCVATAELPVALQALATRLAATDVAAWAADTRARQAARREARRQAWQAAQTGQAGQAVRPGPGAGGTA